jgi:hypothetical protein
VYLEVQTQDLQRFWRVLTRIDHLMDGSQDQMPAAVLLASQSKQQLKCTTKEIHYKSFLHLHHFRQKEQKRSNSSIIHPTSHPTNLHLRRLSVDVGASTAAVALSRNDLVVVRAEVEAIASPGVEVGLHVHGAADALVLADRPVLTEGPGTVDLKSERFTLAQVSQILRWLVSFRSLTEGWLVLVET